MLKTMAFQRFPQIGLLKTKREETTLSCGRSQWELRLFYFPKHEKTLKNSGMYITHELLPKLKLMYVVCRCCKAAH